MTRRSGGSSAPLAEADSIGAPGFEPGTSPTRTVRATRLRHAPRGGDYPRPEQGLLDGFDRGFYFGQRRAVLQGLGPVRPTDDRRLPGADAKAAAEFVIALQLLADRAVGAAIFFQVFQPFGLVQF